MRPKVFTKYVVLLFFAAIFYQCTDDHQERFQDPPWLGGTNIETLEKEGNYGHFIALMDKAEYRISIENQMFTLFVPNDSCFEAYFQTKGITSVDDLNKEQAEELFGLHILVNPRSREQLMYEYAWDELQDTGAEYGTLFHRKQTYSVPIDYNEEVRYFEDFKGETLKLYRGSTFIPLFTTEYFEDYFGDPNGSDYLFMYPGSSWSGTQWNDAMVTEAEVRTSSGFIYYLDRVVAPPPTIDKYLGEHQDEFGLFYDLAQRFASYGSPRVNAEKERRYRKSYTQIQNFAHEWGPNPATPNNMLYMFSSYVPYDNVLQEFLDETVFQYYESIDSVPQLFLVYLLQSHLNSFLTLPSKMSKRFVNYLGDEIPIDINTDIGASIMCSNGIIYGMNKVLEPNAFSCVPGPVFYNNNYTTFLYALQNSKVLTSITQSDIDVTLFAADNAKLMDYGVRTKNSSGTISLERRALDGEWKTFDNDDLQEFVRDFIHFGIYDNFDGEGFIRMASDNYVYFNNGEIYSGGNQVAGDKCTVIEKIPSEKNGNLFYIDNSIKEGRTAAELMLADPDLSAWANLLNTAGLIDSVQEIYEQPGVKYPRVLFMPSLKQRQWTVLAPSNQALADAELAGLIPAYSEDNMDDLRNFIHYHFVRNKCIFDDGLFSGTVFTHCIDTILGSDIVYKTLDVSNTKYNLSVSDGSGQLVPIAHADANLLIKTGVLHKINTVLIAEP